ncbi:PspC domain-containing protein [Xylanimonas ulmi]|uniref:Phage shock protein C (PspC) family protein n=1 Tax=Xylanimonas ulmi TaxID=228973 RepID=A0A4Q7M948_9MICO|nr:PspC domain-containing protein [Xylanibacterium ulmi]RZS62719.1 phage shock protein C (PspC) family protein [Xylanibacterium ulmi]
MSTPTPNPQTSDSSQYAYAPPPPRPSPPFYRPTQGRMIGGVCAAVADYFGWERTVVRLLTVASIFLPGPQVLAYIVLWLLVPSEERFWARRAASQPGAPYSAPAHPTTYPTQTP